MTNEENPFPKFSSGSLSKQRYDMEKILKVDQNIAPFYFMRLVEWEMEQGKCSNEQAINTTRHNLGYFACMHSGEAADKVLNLFSATNPYFGPDRPTFETAIDIGEGRGLYGKKITV